MKHVSLFKSAIFVFSIMALSSCKKDKSEPTPTTNTTPVVNQVSANAPNLASGTPTRLNFNYDESEIFYLAEVIIEPQGDDWTTTSVTSSNTSIARVTITEGGQNFTVDGVAEGTVTIRVVVTDEHGNSNTLVFTVTIVDNGGTEPTNPNGPNTINSFNFSIQAGSNNSYNFTSYVSDPQGDNWSVTNVTSSNTSIATVSISTSNTQSIEYAGVAAGNATITVTVSDIYSNSNSFTIPISVYPKPIGPK